MLLSALAQLRSSAEDFAVERALQTPAPGEPERCVRDSLREMREGEIRWKQRLAFYLVVLFFNIAFFYEFYFSSIIYYFELTAWPARTSCLVLGFTPAQAKNEPTCGRAHRCQGQAGGVSGVGGTVSIFCVSERLVFFCFPTCRLFYFHSKATNPSPCRCCRPSARAAPWPPRWSP